MKRLMVNDLENLKMRSGYDRVHTCDAQGGKRKNPYMAVACGSGVKKFDKAGRSWRGPRRPTAIESAQDYCDYINGNPIAASVKLNRAGHVCVRPRNKTPQVKSIKTRKPRVKKAYRGYVYLISDGTALKLGKTTTHPTQRIGSLQTGNPRLLTLLAYLEVDDVHAVELSLHQKFISLNLLGEWFKDDQTILDEFCYEVTL